jgi:hypothetical protein
MITSRHMTAEDIPLLQASIDGDEHHKGTDVNFWLESECMVNVYEDDAGPVLFLRGSILRDGICRLDIQFIDNTQGKRNLKCIGIGLPLMEEKLKLHNFIGIVFESKSPLLKKYCQKRHGFEDLPLNEHWLMKVLDKDRG